MGVSRDDCVLLPIENTTAELLARYIGERLREDLRTTYKFVPAVLRVEVEESSANRRRMMGGRSPGVRYSEPRVRSTTPGASDSPSNRAAEKLHRPLHASSRSTFGPSQQRAGARDVGRAPSVVLRQRLELDRGLAAGQLQNLLAKSRCSLRGIAEVHRLMELRQSKR